MKAKSLDRKFDEGKDNSSDLDVSKASRPMRDQKRVNVDFPVWMIESLDKEATGLESPGSPSSRFGLQNVLRDRLLTRRCSRTQQSCAADLGVMLTTVDIPKMVYILFVVCGRYMSIVA